MIRTILVVILIIIGIVASFYGSFNALIFYLWMAYFRPESWMWNNWLAGYSLSFFVGIFLLISAFITGVKFRFTLFAGLLLLVAVQSFLSFSMSNYRDIIFSYWIEFIKIIIISYLLTILVRSEKELKITLIAISLSLGFEGAKQGWANLILNPGGSNANMHPLLGDNNGVAVGMIMIVPILFALYQTVERKLFKYGFLFIAIGAIYRALSTYSRGGFLTFLVMCIIYWLRSKRKGRMLLIFALFLALILPTFPQEFWDRIDTIAEGSEASDGSAASRLYFWGLGWEMAKDNQIIGIGHRAYEAAYNTYDHTGGQYGTNRAVHSTWFGLMAEWGFPGFILFLIIYCYSLFSCARVRKICKNHPKLTSFMIYGNSIETSLIASGVGITFLSFQYAEILWHFFALAVICSQILNAKMEEFVLQNEASNEIEFTAPVGWNPR